MNHRKIKRHSKFRFYFLNFLLFFVITVIISGAAIVFFCDTNHVKVKGNAIAAKEDIKKAVLSDKYDTNAVYAFLRNRFCRHVDIPFVESYSVSMKNRNTIVITVKEKELYGYVLTDKGDKIVYYGTDGTVQEVSDLLVKKAFFVDGLTVKKAVNGEPLAVGESNVKTILTIQDELKRDGLKVKKITFSDDGTITFKIKGTLVNLGTRIYIAQKLRRLPYILPKLGKQKGTLHLEEWSEENTDIVFEKDG